jgi:hypothetical protein
LTIFSGGDLNREGNKSISRRLIMSQATAIVLGIVLAVAVGFGGGAWFVWYFGIKRKKVKVS